MKVFEQNCEQKLIGLAGTFASGKDTAAQYLVEEKAFMHVSTGDVLRAEATRQDRDHQRATLIEIGVELRRKHRNLGALVIAGVELWREQKERFIGGLVLSGLRIVDEAKEVKRQNGKLVFIDASVERRFERTKRRADEEGRTAKIENINNLDDFIESERAELEGLDGPERPNLRAVEAISDIVIQNNGTKEEFFKNVESSIFEQTK